MHILRTVKETRKLANVQRAAGHHVGLVPTMGNLHRGHFTLVSQALSQCDFVMCSIFVNPTQFGANEDFGNYPRTFEQDATALEQLGCHCIFFPSVEEVYPEGIETATEISVPEISADYCGASRPGHFDGVATVVTKLFNICQPDSAFFGLKDYQQFLIIKQLVRDLMLPIEIFGVEIQREPDGLAMSSRNAYLNETEREIASALHEKLCQIGQRIREGHSDYHLLQSEAQKALHDSGLTPEYFSICNAENLKPASNMDFELVILAAVQLGCCRLIDNIRLNLRED